MPTGTFTLSGTVDSLLSGSKIVGPLTVSATTALADTVATTLASGANTITIPTGATACIVVPDSNNTGTLILKGVTGDTGIGLNVLKPLMLVPVSGATTFVITSSVGTNKIQIVWI